MVEQADGLSHYMMTFGFFTGFCLNRLYFSNVPSSFAPKTDPKTKIVRFLVYVLAALPAIILFLQYMVFKDKFDDNKRFEAKAWYKYISYTLYGFYTGVSTLFFAPKLL
jgi:hypothetical protein